MSTTPKVGEGDAIEFVFTKQLAFLDGLDPQVGVDQVVRSNLTFLLVD